MNTTSSIEDFESEHPMVVEVISFQGHPGLLARLLVRFSLGKCGNGKGRAFVRDYDFEAVFPDGKRNIFILSDVSDIVDKALSEGDSPLVSIFNKRQDVQAEVASTSPIIEAALTAQILGGAMVRPLAPPKPSKRI